MLCVVACSFTLMKSISGVPVMAQWVKNLISVCEDGLAHWVKGSGIAVSCGAGCT